MATEYKYGNTTVIVHRPDNRMSDEELKKYLREACIEAVKNDRSKRVMNSKDRGG